RVVRDIERKNVSFDLLSNILVHGTIPYERRSVCSTNNALAAALSQAAQPAEAAMRRWKCGLIVDYLIAVGETDFHILRAGRIERTCIAEAAKSAACGVLTYPAKV